MRPEPFPIDTFRRLLRDPTPPAREGALMGLNFIVRRGDDLGLFGEMIALLEDSNPFVRNQVVAVVGRIQNPEFVEPLLNLLRRETRETDHIRAHIAHVLGGFGDKRANKDLVELLRDYNPEVVEQAWYALMRINKVERERSYHIWKEFLIQQEQQTQQATPGTTPAAATPY
jgi:hypothetical protein